MMTFTEIDTYLLSKQGATFVCTRTTFDLLVCDSRISYE
jgi:hypothetical protein